MVSARGENIFHRSVFHDLSGIHHGDIVACFGNNPQIVSDHQHGGAKPLPDVVHQGKYLCLDRHIQRRGRLQLGLTGQCDGNDDPLLHAAGKLRGILFLALGRDAHQHQNFIHPLVYLLH